MSHGHADPHAATIAHAIARARGHIQPDPSRHLHAEIEAISRRLATIEARIAIITAALVAIAGSTAAPAIASALSVISKP